MKLRIASTVLLLAASGALAPVQAGSPAPVVSHPSAMAESLPLSSLPLDHYRQMPQEMRETPRPKPLPPRGAGSGGPPSVEPPSHGSVPHGAIQPRARFAGIGANGYIPPDANIAVGKPNAQGNSYIVEMVNSDIAVYNKSGQLLAGPAALSSLFTPLGAPCSNSNAGDPIAQYDPAADRFIYSELASTSGPYGECIAVSQTNNPSGPWYLYFYSFGSNLNDYPKFGVWPTASNSAYLASYNLFANGNNLIGADLCAYDRAAMMAGSASATQICFLVQNDGGFLPSDLDGATAPANGTPGYFLNFETNSSLRLYELLPDFANPALSTLTQVTPDISVASFSPACNGGACIPQPNSQQLDSLGDRLMYRLAYRQLGGTGAAGTGTPTMVVNHSIVAGGSVGVRWYELQRQTTGTFGLTQQGTFAPDSNFRWMGSAAMDVAGNIALGYSVSSGSLYPSIAFTSCANAAGCTMSAETVMQAGKGAQTTYNRWGDYTSLRIDPSDDKTFWYVNEYYTSNGFIINDNWATAIGSFTVAGAGGGGCTASPDFSVPLLSPNPVTIAHGSSGKVTVSVTAMSNCSPSVTLSASGLPKNTNASFSPNPVAGSGSSTMTINVGRHTAPATYSKVTVVGKDATGTASHALTLIVQ